MTTSARKRRHLKGSRLEYESPRKRFKGNHSNHNIRSNRRYHRNHNAELSQSQSEGDDNEDPSHEAHHPQRAMSQVVYHNAEEIEFEFKQCLSLYSMAPRRKSNANQPAIAHTMSQVVSGRYGDRNHNHKSRNRPRTRRIFIKKSQNNPWDRKMIDFLSNIECVTTITQHHEPTQPQSQEETSPEPTHWMNASLAINLCVKVYGDRVDNLRDRVHRLLSTISHTETNHNTKKKNKIREHRNAVNNRANRRKKKQYVSSHDVHKINRTVTQWYTDMSHKYTLDRLNIIRQTSPLLLSSTQWWLDKDAPWICADQPQMSRNNRENSFCHMLANDINIDLDLDSWCVMDQDASAFFHRMERNGNSANENADTETLLLISPPPPPPPPPLPDMYSHANHNHNNDIATIPFPYRTPPIHASPILASPRLEPRTTPLPLICNRISTTPPRSLRQMEEAKEEEKAERESYSTFHTNTENEDSDSEIVSRSQTFTVPKLRRLTRTCCDMSIMPNLLLDEECLDAFIIDHTATRTNCNRSNPQKRKKRRKKRLRTCNPSDAVNVPKEMESPAKRRRICETMDRIQMISHTPPPPLPCMDNNCNNPSLDSMDTVDTVVELPRGSMEGDLLYQNDISFDALANGVSTYVDEYSEAPSTPKTSVSVPLLTPSTIYSDTGCKSVLSGVMEMEERNGMNGNCMDLNVILAVDEGEDILETLPPLQIEFESQRMERSEIFTNDLQMAPVIMESGMMRTTERVDFMKSVFNGSEITALNKCTYDILCDEPDEAEMTFGELLQLQHEALHSRMPDVTVAMRFLSLLTVCSDSYHKETEYEHEMEVHLDGENINRHNYDTNTMMTAMGDFAIRVSKHSSSADQL